MSLLTLNDRAARLTDQVLSDAAALSLTVHTIAGARVIDAGVESLGGFAAGLIMARICMADLAEIGIVPGPLGPSVQVVTSQPVPACLAAQYAGWQLQVDKWFGMGSGPIRAAYGKEPLFDVIGFRESAHQVVGVVECDRLPNDAVIDFLSKKLDLAAEQITLWCAATGSAAGTTQVVARSVEVALHKLHELKFDLTTIRHGYGIAPLPPLTRDNFVALGRTNDAILYGGHVELTVATDDAVVEAIGPQVPSYSSPTFGQPFLELFKAAGDFYKMDPQLFAPAEMVFHNHTTGRTFTFQRLAPDIVRKSFGN
jgi:methenyltetrahydromethanopterin cyclohydrolase